MRTSSRTRGRGPQTGLPEEAVEQLAEAEQVVRLEVETVEEGGPQRAERVLGMLKLKGMGLGVVMVIRHIMGGRCHRRDRSGVD